MKTKTTFRIPKMDCASEERMIRMKLEGMTTIQSMQFDLTALFSFQEGGVKDERFVNRSMENKEKNT